MSQKFKELDQKHVAFIEQQHIYFVATAGAEGFVNVSPKGMDSFRVITSNRVTWLNLTGSGNETAPHVLENGRMTVMFCSFEKQPMILRLYGEARVIHPRDTEWNELVTHFPDYAGARQLFDLQINLVQTSCGFAVPYFDWQGDRPTLDNWAEGRGRESIQDYWLKKNTLSLDGKNTEIEDPAFPLREAD